MLDALTTRYRIVAAQSFVSEIPSSSSVKATPWAPVGSLIQLAPVSLSLIYMPERDVGSQVEYNADKFSDGLIKYAEFQPLLFRYEQLSH